MPASTQRGRRLVRDLGQSSNPARAEVVSKVQVGHRFGEGGRLLEAGHIGEAMIQARNVGSLMGASRHTAEPGGHLKREGERLAEIIICLPFMVWAPDQRV